MSVNLYHTVETNEIAQSLVDDEENLFDLLGDLAELIAEAEIPELVVSGYSGSHHQQNAITFLRSLADAMEENNE